MNEYDSIWAVSKGWRETFWVVFFLVWLTCVSLIIFYEVCVNVTDTGWETFIAVGEKSGLYVIVCVVIAILITEVIRMISDVFGEWFKKRERNKGIADSDRRWESALQLADLTPEQIQAVRQSRFDDNETSVVESDNDR